MSTEITWLGHASFRLAGQVGVVYIDPWKLSGEPHDADVVFISHPHYDHYSPEDIAKASTDATQIIAPDGTVAGAAADSVLSPGDSRRLGDLTVHAVPAYNPVQEFHPRTNNWLGAVLAMGQANVYYAGDTELIDEMSGLGPVDIALLPVGGMYTMDVDQAVAACERIGCKVAIPYHWGDIVGSHDDAVAFEASAPCDVHVLHPGQSVTL